MSWSKTREVEEFLFIDISAFDAIIPCTVRVECSL